MSYHARPNRANMFGQWWGSGGAELWDAIDPWCRTEDDVTSIGPIAPEQAATFDEHARKIPGYYVKGYGYAIIWKQKPTKPTNGEITL